MRRTRSRLLGSVLALALCTACTSGGDLVRKAAPQEPAAVEVNVAEAGTDVPGDTLVTAGVEHGTVTSATLSTADGDVVEGEGGDSGWSAASRLEPGTVYVLQASVEGDDGEVVDVRRSFTR